MELNGAIHKIFDEKAVSASFRKRELVLETDDRYPQKILVEFTQDKCSLLDGFSPGTQVRVSINIRGREWTSPQGDTKYFVSVQGWKIESMSAGASDPRPQAPNSAPGFDAPGGSSAGDGEVSPFIGSPGTEDDIPF